MLPDCGHNGTSCFKDLLPHPPTVTDFPQSMNQNKLFPLRLLLSPIQVAFEQNLNFLVGANLESEVFDRVMDTDLLG